MKKLLVLFGLVGLFFSCNDNSEENQYKSKGTISGQDLLQCICYCGGYFISINNNTYRFNEDSVIEESIHLSELNLPVDVYLDWESIEPDSTCAATDLIKVLKIKLAK